MSLSEHHAELRWIKASRSGVAACVELATAGDRIAVRDSKNPSHYFTFGPTAVSALLLAAKRCEYDHLVHGN